MRWHTEYPGKVRVRTAFLFFPKGIDGEWRWLEIAKWEETCWVGASGNVYWINQKWIN